MIIDLNSSELQEKITAKICIIGAGAAGITLAKLLAEKNHEVVLLESGAESYRIDSQALNEGLTEGSFLKKQNPEYLSKARLRYIGGTSNHWEGWTHPFDEHELSRKDWIPDSGWGIAYDEFKKYFDKAAQDLGYSNFNETNRNKTLKGDIVKSSQMFKTTTFQMIPVRFGEKYHDFLVSDNRIKLIFNATTTDVITNQDGSVVTQVYIKSLEGKTALVTADKFILAAGGVENARILLNSNNVSPRGIGNDNDLVGRYFSDHPHMSVGSLILYPGVKVSKDLYAITQLTSKEHEILGVITPRDETIYKHKLLNTSFELKAGNYDKLPKDVQKQIVAFLYLDKARGRITSEIKKGVKPIVYRIYMRAEQTPVYDSRLELLDEKDSLGVRKVKLNWKVSSEDSKNYRKSIRLLGQELVNLGIGRLWINYSNVWPKDARGGYHHMGTTRMNNDPKKGVVDSNCRVHGVNNLFIAGSSVFPTYSAWNPTVNFLALVYRLADYLSV